MGSNWTVHKHFLLCIQWMDKLNRVFIHSTCWTNVTMHASEEKVQICSPLTGDTGQMLEVCYEFFSVTPKSFFTPLRAIPDLNQGWGASINYDDPMIFFWSFLDYDVLQQKLDFRKYGEGWVRSLWVADIWSAFSCLYTIRFSTLAH